MAASLCGAVLGSPPASAATYIPSNPHNIKISADSGGDADPFPSTIQAYGLGTRVSDLNVTLNGLSHTLPDDLDIELVAPDGTAVVLMSDGCGEDDLVKIAITFDDSASGSVPNSLCATGSYRPTDLPANKPDDWRVPPTGTSLAAFNGINPNGPWRLYVSDDDGSGDGGGISDGWSLTINTRATPALTFPGPASTDGRGPADTYPYAIPVTGPALAATNVKAVISGLTHAVPGSLQILLVNPRGTAVLLMSGACGRTALDDVTVTFDDSAKEKLSPAKATCSSGSRKPTVQDPVTPLPAPAPAGPYATKLSAFRGGPTTGTWLLYVADTRQEEGGFLANAPVVRLTTDSKPPNTKVTKRPKKKTTRARAKIKFESTEAGSKFQCRIDGRKWRSCKSPLKLKRLKPGKHRVKVRAIDPSGNVDKTPAKIVWRVRRHR